MADPDAEASAQLQTEILASVRDRVRPRLQKDADDCNAALGPVVPRLLDDLARVQDAMDDFRRKRAKVFGTLQQTVGEASAREVFRSGELGAVLPPSYGDILKHCRNVVARLTADEETDAARYLNPVASPRVPQADTMAVTSILSAPDKRKAPEAIMEPPTVGPITPVTPATAPAGTMTVSLDRQDADRRDADRRDNSSTGSVSDVPTRNPGPKQLGSGTKTGVFMKRSSNHLSTPTRSPAKKARSSLQPLKNSPIQEWEVVGSEYIFPYPAAGPGWFILRCDRGGDNEPIRFNSEAEAHAHFNSSDCRYHDTKRKYTTDEMMVLFARQVTDIDEKGVEAANEKLKANAAKDIAKTIRNKAQKTRQTLGPANRGTTATRQDDPYVVPVSSDLL